MKKTWYLVGGVVLIALLAVAYYALSPLFITVELHEEVPQSASVPEQSRASVVGTPGHPASGEVRIVESGGTRFVRYENFKTINGPDLYVYLAKDIDAKDYVDLGRIRATEGSVNYEIPEGVDLSAYHYVLTWCKTFSVLFNYAEINM